MKLLAPVVRISTLCVAVALAVPAHAAWFRGNTHAHTINSDGDSSPDSVVRWYKEHGYNFLFITDHGSITRVDGLNAVFGSRQFLVLPGEEVTSNFTSPSLHVHVNALNPNQDIAAQKGANARETLQLDLDAARAAGAIAQINHPNFYWQLTAADIASTHGATLMEIRNMHPIMNNAGAGPDAPGTEEMWDQVLTTGATVWAVASDDLHRLKPLTLAEVGVEAAPGQGWIMVNAEKLTPEDILGAIAAGRFYASTGVTLRDVKADATEVAVTVEPEKRLPARYVIAFIGAGGRVLQTTVGTAAAYRPRGDEGYVRVRVLDSNGHGAWTQPVRLASSASRR